jgi:hypothetical protein
MNAKKEDRPQIHANTRKSKEGGKKQKNQAQRRKDAKRESEGYREETPPQMIF